MDKEKPILLIVIVATIIFILGGLVGQLDERAKFNKHLLTADGYYWMDATGNRAYAPLEECREFFNNLLPPLNN